MELFYMLVSGIRGQPSTPDTEFVEIETITPGPADTCDVCGGSISMLHWRPPFHVELECWERGFGDVVFGPSDSLLVSDRFRDLYTRSRMTGLSGFEPVTVERIKRHKRFKAPPPRYFHVRTERGKAAVDQRASGFDGFDGEDFTICPECRQVRSGIYPKRWERVVIEPGTWAGEDASVPRGLSTRMASPRFKNLCDEHHVTNAMLIPAEEYVYDFYPWENLRKAREIAAQPVGGPILEKCKRDGTVLRYDVRSHYIVGMDKSGAVLWVNQPLGSIEEEPIWAKP